MVFVPSLPYKFSQAPETQYIFTEVGYWFTEILGSGVGSGFTRFGAYIIGGLEAVASLLLLLPGIVWGVRKVTKNPQVLDRSAYHQIGGLLSSAVMGGAIFFHLFSPLGIEVNGDGGSLFKVAVSVFFAGILLFLLNRETESGASWLGEIGSALKPRSPKHWLFWVEAIPLFFIFVVVAIMSFYAYQANTDRYHALDLGESIVPQYKEIPLPFEHVYGDSQLPFLASAIIDINGDGIDEVFLGGGQDSDDDIFQYTPEGFVSIRESVGIEERQAYPTLGATVLDLDQDGDEDLFTMTPDYVMWHKNNGGVLEPESLDLNFDEKSTPMGLAFGDINADGAADIFVSAYITKEFVEGQSVFNDLTYGARSRLFLNNGDNTFTDITQEAGMDYIHNTFVSVFVDMDGDLDQDLVSVYDTGHIKTWRNNGDLTFTDMPNPTHDWFGYPMGLGVSDYDNDGDVDFIYSNIGDMGVMTPIVKGDLMEDQNYHTKHGILENQGDFTFKDIGKEVQIADYEFGWGVISEDLNNDTRQDVLVMENYVDLPQHKFFPLPGRLLLQTEDGRLTNREATAGASNPYYGIAPLTADFNQDGSLDLIYANLNGKSRALMANDLEQNYLTVELPNDARSLGAKVSLILSDGSVLTDWWITSEGLSSDGLHDLHFGLANHFVQELEVHWLNGTSQVLKLPAINQTLTITPDA